MKFSEFEYKRPVFEEVAAKMEELLGRLEKTTDKNSFMEVFWEIEKLTQEIELMVTLSSVRHSINTKDEFYSAENDYWDEYGPRYQVYSSRLARLCVECPFKEELYDVIPEIYFKQAEFEIKSFDEKIVPLLQKENVLASEYGKLKASAQIEVDGVTYNLSTISKLTNDKDRETRKKGWDGKLKFYQDNEAEFDRIYDDLVKVRDQIAHELGYKNFTELGYIRMYRLDYNEEMVANYRRQILEDITPVVSELEERKARRLGLDKVRYYDKSFNFKSGNPTPKGTYEELIEAARKMYHEMSPETGEFIDTMINGELWDLKSRDGKEMGGYCTSIPIYKVPFIFANFNGTSGDVDVLTHEAGHAFQYYMSRNIPVAGTQWPTMESAEIHSMSMEFNAWPWMNLFFKEDEQKYKFYHLSDALSFLPYGVLVDHFQHEVYNHPQWTPEERKQCWHQLESMYEPYQDFEGAPILEKGCWWYQQGHIFESPFYYIDYTLAQVCALQFWSRNYHHDPNSWRDYLHLCSLGGTLSFTGLVREAGLKNPFEDGCIKDVVRDAREYLDSVDDMNL